VIKKHQQAITTIYDDLKKAGESLNAVEVKVLDAATEGETQRGRTRRRWRWGERMRPRGSGCL
jgi:hypothetical protein